jgi:Aromatic ring hydroxylase
MVIFDDVLVQWERVFIYRDAEVCNGLYNHTGAQFQADAGMSLWDTFGTGGPTDTMTTMRKRMVGLQVVTP